MTRIVVVGASSGIGRAVGIGLARRGEQVALLARRQHRLDLAAEEAGNGAVGIACDVTDPSSVTASTGRPHKSDANCAGSPMVADEKTNVGRAP